MKPETQEQREKRLTRQRAYYAANRERLIACCSSYRKSRPKQTRAYYASYRERNRDALKVKQTQRNVSPAGRKAQRTYWESPKGVIAHYRNASKRRGIQWALPYDLAIDLVTDNCFYCGAAPDPTNGIDRVINKNGYLEDNVVTACEHCNKAKLERSREDFERWAVKVAARVLTDDERAELYNSGAGKFYPFT
jgi:hypothetical protein